MPFGTIETRPLRVKRRARRESWRGKTSGRAGTVIPLAYFALLREDAIAGQISVQVNSTEMVRAVANPIKMRVQAWLIPHVAMERFNGSMETFNRSYMGQKMPDGSNAPTLFSQRAAAAGTKDEIMAKLGIHVKKDLQYNFDVTRAYNVLCNWRKKSVSELLPLASEANLALSRSFWLDNNLDFIKPSFDAALMEGEVDLNINGFANITGLGIHSTGLGAAQAGLTVRETIGDRIVTGWENALTNTAVAGNARLTVEQDPGKTGYPLIRAALSGVAATLSLANMDMAKRLQAFAMLRDRYKGIDDDYLIDLLMQGVAVPEADLRNPILVGEKTTVIGMNERWATDGASLDQSATRGMAGINMRISTPPINTGGVIMVIAEVMPQPLYERMEDAYITQPGGGDLPDYRTDEFDPQKVSVVKNQYVDVLHGSPAAVFGYAPLNYQWQRDSVRVGGKFLRRTDDRFTEDRQVLWTVTAKNPVLGEDFYLAPANFPHSVFADQSTDPFEFTVFAPLVAQTNTVFGSHFDEDHNSYEEVMEDVDQGRVTQPGGRAEESDVVDGVSDEKEEK